MHRAIPIAVQISVKMRLNKEEILKMTQDVISAESIWSKHRTQAHIAVIIKRGKMLEVAGNSIGSRSKGSGYSDRTIHAERAVIKKLGDNSKLDGAVIAVIRIAKGTKEVVNSEPCHSCKRHLEKCMREHGLKCVYYSI
jgi:hypothetical protein